MIFAFFFLIYLFFIRKTKSIAILLSLILFISAVAGILVGNEPQIDSLLDIFNIFYTIVILLIIISPFRKFGQINEIVLTDIHKINRLTIVLICAGIVSMIINSYMTYKIWTDGVTNYSAFKATEMGADVIYALPISHFFITLASLLSPVSYFLLGLSFYYIYARRLKLAAICFLLSLNMPLQGLTIFSRSSSVIFFLLIAAYIVYVFHVLSKSQKKSIIIFAVVSFLLVGVFLTEISVSRFLDYDVNEQSLISDPILYSVFDYLSQWNKNGIFVMSNYYSFDSLLYGSGTNTFFPWLFNITGIYSGESLMKIRETIWPSPYTYSFNGLVACLLFDFGYTYTLAFSLLFAFVAKRLSPIKNKVSIEKLIVFGVIVTFPLMAFTGNYFSVLSYHFAIIYALIIFLYLKHHFVIRKTHDFNKIIMRPYN